MATSCKPEIQPINAEMLTSVWPGNSGFAGHVLPLLARCSYWNLRSVGQEAIRAVVKAIPVDEDSHCGDADLRRMKVLSGML